MRWARLFADLDSQLEAAERADRAAETADLRRLEASRLTLGERLAAALGRAVTVHLEAGPPVAGRLRRVGVDWALLDAETGETLIALGALVAVSGLTSAAAPSADEIDQRLGMGVVLRQLARDRSAVAIVVRTGEVFTGTIDRVGADFLDLAEHAADRPRRPADVQRVRTIAQPAIALVRPA